MLTSKRISRLAPPFLALALALGGSLAFADEASGVRYSIPSGWAAADKDGMRVVAPVNQAAGELMMAQVVGVQTAEGTPDEQIAELAAKYTAGAKVLGSSTVFATDRGSAGTIYMKSFQVDAPGSGAQTRMPAILLKGDRRAVVLFVFSNDTVLRKHGGGLQEFLKSIAIDPKAVPAVPAPLVAAPTPAATSPSKAVAVEGHLPTGDTPNSYPGSPGWLPSGRGVAIPPARLVHGSPEGMWWRYQVQNNAMVALPMIYLPDGTHATNPRPGSGQLFDVEGQRKQRGNTGVGTFSIKDGRITQAADGFSNTDTFKSGSDKEGAWFEIGAGRHYPLELATRDFVVGTWKGNGQSYTFRADGTFETGTIVNNSEVTLAAGNRGTWLLDGYLLGFTPEKSPSYISMAGRTGKFLVIGMTVLTRQ